MKRTIILLLILSLLVLCSAVVAAPESGRLTNVQNRGGNIMAYTANDYARLIGMEGFSEALLKNHFTLYQGVRDQHQ